MVNKPDQTFETLLRFTENDLASNRIGILSKAQQARLLHDKERSTHTSRAVGVMTLIVIGIILISGIRESTRGSVVESSTAILSCVILLLACLALLFLRPSKISEDLDTQKVLSTKGPVKHEKYHHRRSVYYGIISGNHTFKVSEQLYETFVKDEMYILYYTSSMKLIAAEHVP